MAIYMSNDVKEVCTANWEYLTGSERCCMHYEMSPTILFYFLHCMDSCSGYPIYRCYSQLKPIQWKAR